MHVPTKSGSVVKFNEELTSIESKEPLIGFKNTSIFQISQNFSQISDSMKIWNVSNFYVEESRQENLQIFHVVRAVIS